MHEYLKSNKTESPKVGLKAKKKQSLIKISQGGFYEVFITFEVTTCGLAKRFL